MDRFELLLLVLPLPLCFCFEVSLVKTVRKDPDLIPICTNGTQNIITLIVCKIRTERNREECRLLYRHGQDFVHECDSRFTLRAQNQTVFLHLTSLTAEDSGNYTCQCSFPGDTHTLHLNVTVEEAGTFPLYTAVIGGVAAFITVAGIVIGCVLRNTHYRSVTLNRDDTRPEASASSASGSSRMLDRDDPEEPYTSLQLPENDIYQTISTVHQPDGKTNSSNDIVTPHLYDEEKDGGETDSGSSEIYENVG